MVNAAPTILIADRNPRVRSFLMREMTQEGYRVRTAENARDVFECVSREAPVDLIIIDPDLPDGSAAGLVEKLERLSPPVPVVVHTHYVPTEPAPAGAAAKRIITVEKGGSSVERLKQIAASLLKPRRDRSDESGTEAQVE
jgi:DNA-binding NtrC family response regulator